MLIVAPKPKVINCALGHISIYPFQPQIMCLLTCIVLGLIPHLRKVYYSLPVPRLGMELKFKKSFKTHDHYEKISRALVLKMILSTRRLAKKRNYFFFSFEQGICKSISKNKINFLMFRLNNFYLHFHKINLFNTILYKVETQTPEQESSEPLVTIE